jgi:tRNA(His) 5'-end guanylyltransferase
MNVYECIRCAEYPTEYFDTATSTKKALPFSNEEYSVLPTSSTLHKSGVWATLGDGLSANERSLVDVPGDKFFTIRLDGKNFSSVGPRLRKLGLIEDGYSLVFERWMQDVCSFLVAKMNNVLFAYTQSDEITLVFSAMPFNAKTEKHEPHAFNGRRDKLLTLAASMATLRFYRNMVMKGGVDAVDVLPDAVFDARLGVFDSLAEAFQLVVWRSYDCAVNAVSTTLHLHRPSLASPKQLVKMNTLQKLALLHERGVMALMSRHQKYGTLYRRAREPVVITNRCTGKSEVKDKFCVRQVEGLVVRNIKEGALVLDDDAPVAEDVVCCCMVSCEDGVNSSKSVDTADDVDNEGVAS